MKTCEKSPINCLWLGIIGVYANLMLCLLTDYSLWYFFGLMIVVATIVCVLKCREKRKSKLE